MSGDIASLISSVGFPIVACLGLAFFCKYLLDQNTKETEAMRKDHKEETTKMTEALNNNTLALQKLIDKLDKE